MDTAYPLRVHIGPKPHQDLILFNGLQVSRLIRFEVYCWAIDVIVITRYEVGGCFPELVDAPDDSMSNEKYPLKLQFGHTGDDTTVYYKSRPLGYLKGIDVQLEIGADSVYRRNIVIKAYCMEQELIDELVKIKGVEVIVEPHDTRTEVPLIKGRTETSNA